MFRHNPATAFPAPFATISAQQRHNLADSADRDPLHRRFNLPTSELLIEDYACALQAYIYNIRL